ncbi:MAG TPA: pyridoxal phosphate-dependent aminotransferase [Candidatus Thermoplasmatota archaeon]|nr:pyridoxal phosphate-dependent aminotransferase [Candidatus Thermoplasmatota archaeon]
MPRGFASRMGRVKESGTVRITDAVQKLRKEGREIISFSVGEPDFDTPEPAREALKAAVDAGHTHYVSAWGIPPLRDAIATKSREENRIPCEAKHVLVTPAKQAIFYAILATVEKGDEVLIPDPAWVSYEPIVELAGGKVVRVPATIETDFRMTPEAIAERVTSKTKMLITNSPSNPTGGVATPADVRGWCDLARDHDLWLLSDELYEKLIYEGEHLSPASQPGMFERTLTVNGFSKAYAMTGWRMGWLVGDMPAMKEIIKLQQHSLTHPAAYSQHGALAALAMDQAPVGAMRDEFRARRDLVVAGLRRIPGWECNVPKGAFYVFAKYHHKLDSMAMAEKLLHEGGVAVTPGIEFGPLGEGHVRISYANSRDNLRRGLERIADVCAKLPL